MEEASLLYLLGKEKCCMPPTHTLHPSSPPPPLLSLRLKTHQGRSAARMREFLLRGSH